jgi:predicted ATPase/class 3 adenylate cyclase
MQALPHGTVTFLFTDIESSTRLWHDHAAAMPAAYARHDAILREAANDEGGGVFKTVGDAFQIAFPTAIGATIAALRAQQALQREAWAMPEPLRVRMALHTGAVDPDADGDYRSPALNRLGRLLGAGHGGQVLVSQATMELARDHLPAGTSFRDLGEQRLKDLYRPEHVYQLEGTGLHADFPDLLTLDSHPNNLPTQMTQFIGRQDDVQAVRDLLLREDARLVTLTGPGGIGKTRLSLQVAADVLESFADGVFFVRLDTLTDPLLVPGAIAQALGLRENPDIPAEAALASYLHDRDLLLVLDNLEQVIDAAISIGDLLVSCPGVKVLSTSRVRLQLEGEQEFPVQPMQLPKAAVAEDIAIVSQYESVRLFIERARLVKPDFTVTNENAPAIAGICIRLDGLPLAIELAAARIRMLSPGAMLRRLAARLPMLTGGARNLPVRQQTLRGAIAWSYELLGPEEQALFRRLSVFAGGATLEAIEAVAVDEDAVIDVFEALERLVDHSLVRQTEIEDEPRFSMFETIREFGLDALHTHGESDEAHRRHAQFFTQIAATFQYDLSLADMAAWLNRMELERDNVRAAVAWTLEHDIPIAYRLIGRGTRLWSMRGPLQEGKTWVEKVLEKSRDGVPVEDVAMALRASAPFLNHEDNMDINLRRISEAYELYLETGRLAEASMASSVRGTMLSWSGETGRSLQVYERAVAMARESGDGVALRLCLNNLGYSHYVLHDLDAASRCFDELLPSLRTSDNHQNPFYLNSIADLYLDLGRLDEAEALYQESLQAALTCQWFSLMSFNLKGQVRIAITHGQWERAATLGGGEVKIQQGRDIGTDGDPDVAELNSDYERALVRVQEALGPDAYREAWMRGASMSMEHLVAEAAKAPRKAGI